LYLLPLCSYSLLCMSALELFYENADKFYIIYIVAILHCVYDICYYRNEQANTVRHYRSCDSRRHRMAVFTYADGKESYGEEVIDMLLKLESMSRIHRVLTPTGMYPKYPVRKVLTGYGLVDKVQPKVYFVGSCLVTVRP